MRRFFDTNVLVYAQAQDPRSAPAQAALLAGGVVSIQVLNEFVNVARRKLGLSWPEVREALDDIRQLVEPPVPITDGIHSRAIDLAEHEKIGFYDALVVAAAIETGCTTLLTEDMQDGRKFGGLTITNPFP